MRKDILTGLMIPIVAKTLKGTFAFTVAVMLITTGASRADVLLDNAFDNGTSQNWTLAGNASIYSGTNYSYNSTSNALYLDAGGSDATLTDPLALSSSGYTNVTWSFYVNADQASGYGEKYYFQYSNDSGTNWNNLASGSLQYLTTGFKEYSVSTANLSDNFFFRILVEGGATSKRVYADSMLVTATPDVPPSGTVVIIK